MKHVLILLLVLSMLCTALVSCGKKKGKALDEQIKEKIAEDGEYNILLLGDDFLKTGKVDEYFEKLCEKNDKAVTIDCVAEDKARMKTFAEKCDDDKDFEQMVKDAEIIVFEEGTAETSTTVESVQSILEHTEEEPITVFISFYGYPRWMYTDLFKDPFPDMQYANANYYISSVIAADEFIIGYNDLYQEDYIHPNEFNGYLTAMTIYCEIFDATPSSMNLDGFEEDEAILACCKDSKPEDLPENLKKIYAMFDDLM